MKTRIQILRWLRANLGKNFTGGLTSSDMHALMTSVNLCHLISYESADANLFGAYRAIVLTMQPHTRGLAYHAIACELDWSHRQMIWTMAGLAAQIPTSRCACEGGAQ